MLIKNIVIFLALATINSYAGRLEILSKLSPAGSLEISSNEVMGHLLKKEDLITSNIIFIPINSLSSGVVLRDQHIHNYFKEKKYKKIAIRNVQISKGRGTGELSINGVTKKVKFKVKRQRNSYTTQFRVNRKYFKLPKAEFMGISVNDTSNVKVSFPFKEIVERK